MAKKRWKTMDLKGEGLQRLNLYLRKRLKKRRLAYTLWPLFPLGLHRLYLREPWGALAYLSLSLGAWFLWSWIPLALMLALALFDLFWIDSRVATLNKQIRMKAFFERARRAKGPP